MVTVASGGDSPFVLARSARALVERRTVPGERSDAAARRGRAAARRPARRPTRTSTPRPGCVVAREAWRLDDDGPAASLAAALEAALASDRPRQRCAATVPRALLDGGAAVAGGRHPGPGLRAGGWWAARGRRVGRPRPGAAVCRRPHRRAVARLGGRACPLTHAGCAATRRCSTPGCASRRTRPTPFTIPGHKQRHDLVGDVVAGDVPLYAGLDTMKLARGVVAEAEARAARLWGADLCRFSVGGSTHGNQALALAVARPGDRVVVARTLHRSMLLGLVLAGLEPVWVRPEVDPTHGLPTGVTAAALEAALAGAPDARAVFVGDPSYVGTVGDVGALATVAHRHGIPLVVDAAWGAHLGFHPALPPHALAAGADALVTSAHKALPAWSQGALVLARAAGSAGPGSTPPSRRPPRPARRAPSSPASTPPGPCSSATARPCSARSSRPWRRCASGSPGCPASSCSTAPGSTRCG